MKRKRTPQKPVFKEYNQEQPLLLPPSLDELIPAGHIVRFINTALNGMKLDFLLRHYPGGGCSSYHPVMMLKVLIYAYTQNIYSSRQIAKALRENVQFMWISGNNRPDFRTINRFRGTVLKETIETVFSTVLELLLEKGVVRFEEYFVDGTKIEADAGRYTFVWKKGVEKNRAKLIAKIRDLLIHIDQVNDRENRNYGERDLEELCEDVEISADEIAAITEKINTELSDIGKAAMAAEIETLEQEHLPRLRKYEKQLKTCGKRNSYSKTDQDATFMRMKDDHMRNGQLKPGYNVQIGTENQFIMGYSVHQKAGDTTTLIPHLEKLESERGELPKTIIADAGYGSEENYAYLEGKNIEGYVKYNYLDQEKKRKYRTDPFRVENLDYDQTNDWYRCPAGRILRFRETRQKRTENGFAQEIRMYVCDDCRWCRYRLACHKSLSNRKIEVNPRLNAFKAQVRENLSSERGRALRARRCTEPETVFGDIKQNRKFRRFLLRGLEKVSTEWGLIAVSHNFLKLNRLMA